MLVAGRFFANAAANQGNGMLDQFIARRTSLRRIADIFGTLDCGESFDRQAERSATAKSCGTTKA